MSEITWEVSGGDNSPDKPDKMPYVEALAITDDMAPGTREFARIFNEMRASLLKNNLMKKR